VAIGGFSTIRTKGYIRASAEVVLDYGIEHKIARIYQLADISQGFGVDDILWIQVEISGLIIYVGKDWISL
jgi:hypothetical protein